MEVAQLKIGLEQILSEGDLQKVIFCFKAYSCIPRGITKPLLFFEMSDEVSLIPREACLPRAKTLLAIVSPILLLCKLEQGEKYLRLLSQRVVDS